LTIDRRTFLGAAGAALAATAARGAGRPERYRVAVLGAGLAGLNAALLLEDQGVETIVLEAQAGPGGRLFTLRQDGRAYNCGATTIGPEYGRIRALAERFGVALVNPMQRGGMAWHINGAIGPMRDWPSAAANRTRDFERPTLPTQLEQAMINRFGKLPSPDAWRDEEMRKWDVPLDEFYRACGISDEAIRLIEVASNCESLHSTSALFQMKELQSISSWGAAGGQKNSVYEPGSGDFHYIAGGSDQLPIAIAKGMKSPVRCSTPVASVVMGPKGAEVTCADGTRIACDYVISAIPFTALSRVKISPAPTGLRAESIGDALYMGTSHYFFEVTAPYWEKDGFEPGLITDASIERVFANKGPSGQVEWLDIWVNGAGVRPFDRLAPAAAATAVTEELYRLRPAMRGAIRFVGSHSWARNPWVTGNKHIFKPGQVSRFAKVIAEPWHRLHFAGEHTRDVEPGMEAAAATGERAAFEILERLGRA
jgi:monoamine oxidase